jgi:hypothetical protein
VRLLGAGVSNLESQDGTADAAADGTPQLSFESDA